jgi:hypothetical protein
MFEKLVENIDLLKYPEQIHPNDSPREVTIGDLQGCSLLLLHSLIREGILVLDSDNYKKFLTFFTIEEKITFEGKKYLSVEYHPHHDQVEAFSEIIRAASLNPNAKKNVKLRLIGDELADRIDNDFFTLKFLQTIITQGLDFETLASNHGMDFLCSTINEGDNKFYPKHETGHNDSLINLHTFIKENSDLREEVINIVETVYRPRLKVLSYTLSEDGSKIIIYTHAPSPFKAIAALAKQYKVKYQDDTARSLAATIDRINAVGQKKLADSKFLKKFESDSYKENFEDTNPLATVTLKRVYLSGASEKPENEATLEPVAANDEYWPATKNGYSIEYAHGHDGFGAQARYIQNDEATDAQGVKVQEHVHNIDGAVGRIASGKYPVLACSRISPVKNETSTAASVLKTLRTEINTSDFRPWFSTTEKGETISKISKLLGDTNTTPEFKLSTASYFIKTKDYKFFRSLQTKNFDLSWSKPQTTARLIETLRSVVDLFISKKDWEFSLGGSHRISFEGRNYDLPWYASEIVSLFKEAHSYNITWDYAYKQSYGFLKDNYNKDETKLGLRKLSTQKVYNQAFELLSPVPQIVPSAN